ncbi:shikimate kinase [Pararhizobium haloflavum]|uniref:shikimate kinase n=1 Tax=Pararhizobium haloflavum TaxID=2037914 RepID=UPI000C17F62F|nr:shikimate kinase [Pararhizobium haloflavum]
MSTAAALSLPDLCRQAREAIGTRNLVFVGLMGAGKSVIGRMTASALQIPFIDSDAEIERVSRMTIAELFETYGETEFRSLEARVIRRLLKTGPRVLSTGGGAFVNGESRTLIKERALSVWLEADLEVLWERVSKRDNRPLLKTPDPRGTLQTLMTARYPIYAEADITVRSRAVRKETIVEETLAAIAGRGCQ